MDTTKYKRKPIYVDAVRVTNENFTEVAHWCQGAIVTPNGKTAGLQELAAIKNKHIAVRVVNPQRPRQTKAFVGDWVLYSEYNGYKVYTDGAFKNAFDEVRSIEEHVEAERDLEEKLAPPAEVVSIREDVPDGTYGDSRPAS